MGSEKLFVKDYPRDSTFKIFQEIRWFWRIAREVMGFKFSRLFRDSEKLLKCYGIDKNGSKVCYYKIFTRGDDIQICLRVEGF